MKLNCGPSWQARFEAKHEWHRLFAWRPIRVGENDCRWLEYVERKGRYLDGGAFAGGFWIWEYRTPVEPFPSTAAHSA